MDGIREDLRGKATFLTLNIDDGAGEMVAEKHKIPPGGFAVYDGKGEIVLTLDLPKRKEILKAVEQASMEENRKGYFGRVAKDWDRLREKMFSERLRDLVVRESHVLPESVVVDVGCGTGFLSEAFLKIAGKVIGVDSSPEMLAQAKINLADAKNLELRKGLVDLLPLKDGEADIVVGNMILHHSPNPFAAIKEMARVLKPGGLLILSDLDKHEHARLREEQKDLWLGFDRENLKRRFELAGLSEVEVKDTDETCRTCPEQGGEIKISIFLAKGRKK